MNEKSLPSSKKQRIAMSSKKQRITIIYIKLLQRISNLVFSINIIFCSYLPLKKGFDLGQTQE
jgi:hypothetical protein